MDTLGRYVADAVLGIDTLWGGDVMCASGTGRFIADSWFSDEPLPAAYTVPAAARVRETGGVGGKGVDRQAVEEYLRQVDLPRAIAGVRDEAEKIEAGCAATICQGLSVSLETMWDLAMEVLGKGEPVPYARCVESSTGRPPEPSKPAARSTIVWLNCWGGPDTQPQVRQAFSGRSMRGDEIASVPMASVRALGAAVIAYFDQPQCSKFVAVSSERACAGAAGKHRIPAHQGCLVFRLDELSGTRAQADGSPQYEATYEINASLSISVPEFQQLVSHEVVPGHVTTFAYLQNLYVRGKAGFEATVLTMNTRAATLFEGIANNAILIAHGVTEIDQLPDEDLQIGVLLALLQDDAKNQSSYLTWGEGKCRSEKVAATLRQDFLVTEERADKLSGAWGQHPLLGRMYLPAYRAGTERVAQLRRTHSPDRVLPAIYGCSGLADIVTIDELLK